MNTLETYYTYAKLSQAAYIDLSPLEIGSKNPFNNDDIAQAAKDQERVPLTLAQNIFSNNASNPDRWTMLSPYYRTGATTGHSDPASGFAGMLLSNPTYGKVLAISGTEPGKDWQTYYDLVVSDVGEIGFLGLAFRQAVSLFNYVQELSAPQGQEGVLRLTVRDAISSAPPPG